MVCRAGRPGVPNRRIEMADKPDTMVVAPPRPVGNPFATAGTRHSELTAPWTLPGGLVDGGEIIVLAIKPSMWRPIFESAAWLVTSAGLAVTMTLLGTPLPGLSLILSAQIVLLVGLGRLGFAIMRWVPSWYVLTNRRIIEIRGVRRPRIAATPLLQVRNTYVNASGIERMTGTGTITYVITEPHEPPHHWLTVAAPVEVHAHIRRAIENAIDAAGG